LLEEIKEIDSIETDKNKATLLVEKPEDSNPVIVKKLINSGAQIIYFNEVKATLEEIYLNLIKNEE